MIGRANDRVTSGSDFAALAYRYRLGAHAVGVGVARVFLSLRQSGFQADRRDPNASAAVVGVRLHYTF
jgi:hypothetical protein